jgi:septal ring-binding cell division protein DamX
VTTTLPAKAVATPSPTPAASAKAAPAKAEPTPRPEPAKDPPAGAAANVAEARGLMRKGQFAEASRGFHASLKEGKSGYSIQLFVSCSDENLQKAVSAVTADELYILPTHYKGKDCYRVGWSVFDSEAKASTALRSVPEYFRRGGATPKVVAVPEILR